MKNNGFVFGLLTTAVLTTVFAFSMLGCAVLSNLSYQMESGRTHYIGGATNFETGKVYNVYTSFLHPAEKTGSFRNGYYEWSGVRSGITEAGEDPAGEWWLKEH
jgi:hypothetical protein